MKYSNFNIRRFWRISKWSIVCNWKAWLKLYMLWSIALGFVFCAITWENRVMYGQPFETLEGVVLSTHFVMFFLVVPSMLFNTLKTKQKKIEYFTLPATNLEKYVSCFVVTNLVCVVAVVAGTFTADVIRLLFSAVSDHFSTDMLTLYMARDLFDVSVDLEVYGDEDLRQMYAAAACALSSGLWVYTCYMLGASLFKKSNWILTSLAVMLVSLFVFPQVDFESIFSTDTRYGFFLAITAVFVVLSALNVWASYKLFTRIQIVNNKWVNL